MSIYNKEYAKKVYAGLLKRGYTSEELGDEVKFVERMGKESNRRILYDVVQQRNNANIGSWERFNGRMSSPTSVNKSSYTFTEQELKEKFGPEEDEPVVPMSNVFQFGMAPVNMAQTTSNAGGGRAEKPLTSLANPYDEKRYSGFSRREIEWLANQPEEVRREQISDDVLMAQMEKIAREDIDTEELKYQLSELSVRTGAELDRYAQERGAKQAQEEEKKPLWRRVLENMPKGGGVASTPDYVRDNASIIGDARWNTLKAADSLNKESQSIIEAVEKDKGFAGGVANKLSDIETWLPMLTAMKSSEILQLVDKFEKGEELTKDEENLLDALAVNVVVKQAYGSDVSNAYSAGQSVAEMPGFMAEMVINPLSGASNMLVSRLGKYAVKKGIGAAILRAGAKVVGATAAGAGMAVTTGLPRTAADAMNRMAGQADYEIRDGKVEYAGQVNRESALEAGYKAVAEGAIQNASEMLGAEWATKGVATVGKKVLGKSKAGREVLKALDAIENSAAGKAVKAFQNATKWNGTVEEFIEEIEAGVGSAVFVGDQEIKDVFDRDNLATTFLAVLAPGVTMGAVQTAGAVGGYYTERYRMGRELNRARRVVEELMGEDAAEYINALDGADENTMNAILAYVDESELSKEQKTAIMKYAAAKLKSDVSTSVLDVLATEEDAELEAAFTQGTETEPTPENKQVARTALLRAEEEMRSRLGWGSEADIELFLREHSAEELAMGDEQALQAINNYKREKAFVEGMRASIQDRREERYAEVDKSIDKNANKVDGNVYSTTYNGEEVFITGGNVVLNDNGTVDYDASSDALYITFPDGHTKQVAAKNFAAVVNTESAEDLKAAKHLEIDSELNAELEANEQQGAPAENGSAPDQSGENTEMVEPIQQTETTQALPKEKQEVQSIPMEKRGKVERAAYHLVSMERTMEDLHDGTLEPEEIEGLIDARVKEAESDVKAVEKEKPVIGADKNAYLTAKEQWKADMEAAQAKLDYYNRLKKVNAEATRSEMRDVVEGVQPQVLIEQTADEFVANLLGGIKITPESFQRETGLKGEQKQLVGVIAGADKGGITVEQAAEQIVENYGDELAGLGFNGDVQDMRDMIINILSNGNPRSYAKKGAEMRAAQSVDEQMSQWESLAIGMGFKDTQEMIEYEEAVVPRIIQDYTGFDEIEYFNNLAENYKYDTTRESESAGRGSELLQGKQSADNAGDTNIAESGQGGNVQGDVYSGGENATPQGNQQQIGSSEIPNSSTISQASEQVSDQVAEETQAPVVESAPVEEVEAPRAANEMQPVSEENLNNQSEDNLEMVTEGGNAPGQGGVSVADAENVESEPINEAESVNTEAQPAPLTSQGVVNTETLQPAMSESDFAELVKGDDIEAMRAYIKEIDDALRMDDASPLAGEMALREEYRRAVEQYGKENIPAEVMQSLNERMKPYAELSRELFDRKYALQDRVRELESAAEKATAAKEKQKKVEDKNAAFGGFLADKTDLAASTAEKALSKKYNFDGNVMTVAEFVEDAVGRGDVKLSTIEEPKYKGASRAAWNRMDARQQEADAKRVKESGTKTVYTVNDHDLGKTAYDYAKFLQEKKTEQEKAAAKKAVENVVKPFLKEKSEELKPATAKIEDVGEKIGGARKDVIRKYADKIKLDGKTFGTMFPKPEIDQLVEAGLPLDRVAAVKAMYDNAKREYERTKKRLGKDKALSASLFYVMYAKNVLNGETDNFDLKYNGWVFTDWGKEYMKANIALYRAVFEKLGAEYGKLDLAKYAITPLDAQHKKMFNLKALNESNARMQALRAKEKGEEPPVYKDGDLINFVGENHARPSDQFETLEEAVNAMVERIGKEVKPGAEALYKPEVYWKTDERGRADYSKIFVGVKVRGFGTVDLMEFKSSNEARQWLDEHSDDFQQMAAAKEVQVKAENKKPLPKYSIEYTLDRVNSQYAVVANFGRGKVHTLRTFDFPEDDARARMSVFKDEVMPFLNSQEAVQAANEYAEELQQKKSAPKNVVVEKNSRERVGVDWRNGQDATVEMFVDVEGKEPSVFGFRALEFGNYVSQKERQQYLNDIYDALMDMSEVLGVSPRALSLGGKLALAVGARGTSGASGHYEPYKNVINITKTKGAGVLAHEWLHALDRYFSNFDENALYPNGVRYATGKEYAENTRQEIKDAFEKIMSAVRGGEYQKRSARLGDYWASDKELAARALQDYMMRKLDERGQKNDFLSNHVAPEEWDGDVKGYPFPLGEDVKRIADAFDNLFATLEEKTTDDGNVVLYSIAEDAMLQDKGTEAFERATEETMNALAKTGVEVVMATDEQVDVMMELAEMQKRTAPETVSVQDEHLQTVVSSADGAKVLKDLDNAINEYEKDVKTKEKTFLGRLAEVLNAKKHGSNSQYATFEAVNGKVFTIRLANHNAKTSTFDNHDENEGISIVVTAQDNNGVTNDGNAHLVEFFYDAIKLRKAEGKPLVEILKSIKQALYSGEYKDNTGLAVREEVNIPEMMTVFHGSGAKFDKFDHSYMGTGEGAQAFGWGTYVTEVEGIGKQYATAMRDKAISDKHKENAIINNLARQVLSSNNGDKNAALEELRNLLNESWSDKKRVKAEIKIIETGKFLPETKVKANLYSVEIPDDNGSNYLYWKADNNQETIGKLNEAYRNMLLERGVPAEDISPYFEPFNKGLSGESIYKIFARELGSDKVASEFLNRQGFVGISYPANTTTGGRADGARNYVIFNENDAQITDRVEFLRTSNGTVYGWAVDGKIYLTPDGVNPNTPVHEYTHLWASAVEQRNPELWTEIVGAMKLSPVWAEVMADEAYRNIWNDDNRVASEVLSRLSGAENYRRAMERAQADIEAERNAIEKIKKIAGWESVKQALSDFWNKVKELLGMPVKGELESDAPAWIEFVDSIIGDFYEGVNPNVTESPMEGMFIGEKGARSLDRREEENGDFNFTPRREVSTEEREKKMNTRTEELAEALNERGFDTTISKSRTSFGMSNYITVRSKSGEVLKKIRLSDHSVTNTGRVLNEYHTMSTDTVEGIVADLMGEKEREIGNRISNLTNAKYMESRGKDAKTIKLATGWERGADGKWRYETEDVKVNREAQLFDLNDNKRYPVAGFIEKGRVDIDATVRLDKLIDDEALFDAYPELREYYVTFEEMEPGTVGSHNYDDKVIRFNRRESIDKLTSTLNHEIQHAVQHIEGFALGSNVERFADVRGAVLRSLNFMTSGDLLNGSAISDVQSLRDALNKKIPYTEMSVKEGYADNLQKVARKYGYENIDALVDDFTNMPSAFEQYRRTAGEVESRNVQERMGMTPEERRNSLAEETADVAKEDQIFLFENQGTSAMMGSRVDARMAQVASELDARELSPEQRAVADVFGGKADNLTISVKTKEGNERKVVMRQGNEAHAGTKHSLYRHYNTGSGAITTDDILLIPEILANGERTENKRGNTKLAVYRLTDGNGTRYTVVTEVKEKGEVFNDFYTNKKASNQTPQMPIGDTQSSARTNDSNAPSADKGNSKSSNEQATDEILSQQDSDEVAMTKGAINALGEKLNTPMKILEDTAGLDERQKKAKGWYDTKTGEVVIVLPNNISLDDAIETVLHELVGHKGLRGVMGEAFDSFLDFVYENAAPEMKRAIDYRFLSSIREGKAMTLRECTEEYIASLAERGFDGYNGVWNAIKQWLRNFFRRFANVNVSDGELRYMLWKSYNRLQRGPIAEIEDIAMEDKTNTGDRANRFREVANDGISNRYDQRVEGIWNQFKEGWIDATRSMKVAQEEIQKEVGRVIVDTADFFNFTNTVPSRNRNKMDRFEVQLMNPFLKFLGRILTDKEIREKDLERYANAKHGIERNREMAVKEAMYDVVDGKRVFNTEAYEEYKKRKGAILTNGKSWIEQQNELDALATSFGTTIKDYSGFTAIFAPDKEVKYADLRKAAVAYVAKMEAELGEEDTKTLWKHIGDINGFSQNEALESGRISKEVFDANAQRYQYYVPLRGFTETTADEMYDYVSEQKSVLNSAQKRAQGRKSEANNIFATMLNIANSEIVFGNKNLAKQRLLNCALLYKTNLLSVGEAWYEKGDNNEYTPIYPNINDAMSNEQIAEEIAAFEERCKEREKQGEVTRKRQGVELKYKSPDKWNNNQHAVSVMRNGREYTVYVNGSPRLAQAMNGLLMEQDTNKFFNVTDAINRFRAKMVTGYSPKFVVTNGVRDIQESTVFFFAKYGVSVAKRFSGNVMKIMPEIHRMFRLYEKNELDMNNEMHRYFKEFLENGGETGYSAMISIQEYEKKINDNIKAKSVLDMSKGALESAQDLVEFANRGVENVCRFAAYMTSRENGLSVLQSVVDAKNVSVNFNRKGSGATGNLEARKLFMFLNPAVQSLVRRVELTRKYPKRMAMVWATELALGAALPVIWNVVYDLLGGDDDEALNNYYNLSDFTRRANLCIPLSNGVVKIPLSHEARVLYSLGEVITSAINGHSEYDNVTADVINSFAQILPLNPMEGWAPGDNIGEALAMNLSPDAMKFFTEILLNKDFAGNRIHNASDFNKHLPERLRGKRGTAKVYQMVSDILSGDYERNFFDEQLQEFLTPSSIEHIVKSYLGGMYSTANELIKTAQWIGGDEEYAEFKNVPIANAFYQSLEKYEAEPGERTRRDWEKAYQNFFEVVGRDYDTEKTVKGLIKNGDVEALSKLQEMENRGELLRIDIFNDGQKRLKELYEEKDAARNMKDYTLSDEIDKRIYAMKRDLVTRMETLADDPMSGYLMLTEREDSEYGVRETYGDARDVNIINEFQRSIKPIIDGAKQSENRTKYTNAYSKEFEIWRILKRCEDGISKRKKSMENNPDECDRYMMEIRKLRADAVKLINEYE